MNAFGPDPKAFFDDVYRNAAPWDIGSPQPALVELFAAFPPTDPVLDVGCGSGDLAIYLAEHGHEVTGVDFAEVGIELARRKSLALPRDVSERLTFRVADALAPDRLGRQFGTVVDSGFLHVLDQKARDTFAESLARTLAPGGRYYLLAFATEFDMPNTPRKVTEEELRTRFEFARGWVVHSIRPAEFLSTFAPVPAIAACFERRMPST
ncbi:MAG TPA: class I SAM-dependent methyltransferase [Gemmatimonadaceae bacterium]|nr:class I SAM-dependent methyltransferase [Gemmatimonadaceae bacterium]